MEESKMITELSCVSNAIINQNVVRGTKYERLKEEHLFYLLKIISKYDKRFVFGLSGDGVVLEIEVKDKYMQEMVEIMGFEKCDKRVAVRNYNKRCYQFPDDHERYELEMYEEETKQFLSIFEKQTVETSVDKIFLHAKYGIFKRLNEEEMKSIFIGKKIHLENYNKIVEEFAGKGQDIYWRRIKLLIGNGMCTKLVYIKSTDHITEEGLLRFHFDYITYDEGRATTYIDISKKKKVEKKIIDVNLPKQIKRKRENKKKKVMTKEEKEEEERRRVQEEKRREEEEEKEKKSLEKQLEELRLFKIFAEEHTKKMDRLFFPNKK
jgi:hypothetical protein